MTQPCQIGRVPWREAAVPWQESVSARAQDDPVVTKTQLDIVGPFDLRAVAMMGFGHRDERRFDGIMRMAFCLDGDYERQVGVEARQSGDRLELRAEAAGATRVWHRS